MGFPLLEAVLLIIRNKFQKGTKQRDDPKPLDNPEIPSANSSQSSMVDSSPDRSQVAHERIVWGRVKHIPESDLIALARSKYHKVMNLPSQSDIEVPACTRLRRTSGSYNVVNIMQFADGRKVVIRIPGHGHRGRWQDGDAVRLRSEAITMRLIREKTRVPVPEIYAYDDDFENEIEAPFILMSFLEGRQASEAWVEASSDYWRSPMTDTIVREVAKTMQGFSSLTFDKIGMLHESSVDPDAVVVGDLWQVHSDPLQIYRRLSSKPACRDARSFLARELKALCTRRGLTEKSRYIKLLNILIASLPFKERGPADKKPFVLMHPDLDLHNILVDEEGQVTGILDWEGVQTVPREFGWVTHPVWLRADWENGYPDDDETEPGEPTDAEKFELMRRVWVDSMRDADEGDFSLSAVKSHLWWTLFYAVTASESQEALACMDKVMGAVLEAFLERATKGSIEDCERAWLATQFVEFFGSSESSVLK